MEIKIIDIHIPEQRARSSMDPEQMEFLKSSYAKFGTLSRILVRKLSNGSYELIDGENRVRAALEAGEEVIDCHVVEMTDGDSSIANLLLNVARGRQSPMGACLALNKAKAAGVSWIDMAKSTGHTEEWVRFHCQLSELPEPYQEALELGKLKVTHIRHAFRLPTPAEIGAALKSTLVHEWNTQILGQYVNNRLREYEVAAEMSTATGSPTAPPAPEPQRLASTAQCLCCGRMLSTDVLNLPRTCDDCYKFTRYAIGQVGTGDEGMKNLFEALSLMQSFQERQQQFALGEKLKELKMVEPTPMPAEVQLSIDDEEMMIKPDNLTAEQWGEIKRELRERYKQPG